MFSPVTAHQYLSRTARSLPDKEALICGEERLTYRQIDRSSQLLAGVLRIAGLQRGDRVVIFMNNSVETVISLYGVLKAGGVFVILDGVVKSKKLGYVLRDTGASILITHTSHAQTVTEAIAVLPGPCTTIWAGPPSRIPARNDALSWTELFNDAPETMFTPAAGPRRGAPEPCVETDLAALIYTSGSTGEPKGVMVSHANMISAAKSVIEYLGNTRNDIILTTLPLSFSYGLYQVLMAFMFGGTVILERSFAYPVKILERLERERATGFPLVPMIAAFLAKMTSLNTFNLDSLRYLTSAAAALPVPHLRKLRSLLPRVRLFSMYGLTECKRVSYLPPEELDRKPGSVGVPIPNSEVFLLNEAGSEAQPGETGELVVRGPHVTCGYWNAPELTAQTFRPGRFPGDRLLYTGDLFKKDEEGFLYFVARKKEIIKTRGERVSPREIENVLHEVDGVLDAAVFGVPDEITGQAIIACIVPAHDVPPLSVRNLLKFCSDRLEPYMIPKQIVMLHELPKTQTGKIDKNALRRDHAKNAIRLFERYPPNPVTAQPSLPAA